MSDLYYANCICLFINYKTLFQFYNNIAFHESRFENQISKIKI